ncbi:MULTISPECIES: tetratricopeptide repeat protein [unclassified Moorena]|uniref:tetratricopeptide repeat protein n=1 Tax=unclassified Moorena TaxID=2683338 RepID=UPI0013B846BF|nr:MULTISPECIES: tetratricopeptide repeat protein [unclassified Moorena]NEQ10183.1 tetratricopeptide repeat protein [Moorena sp. SIO4E2]NER86819.1 tetratricopeptide repeat protein [Moorena sp. SIO3A2]
MDYKDKMDAQRAETFRMSGDYEQAIEIFEELQIKYPDNAWVNAHLGITYHQLMDYHKARKYLKKAIEKNRKYLWAHAQLGETYRLLAIIEDRQEEYVELAIEHFQAALGNELPEKNNYAWALAHLGAIYRLKMIRNIKDSGIDQKEEKGNPEYRKDKIIEDLKNKIVDEESKENALHYLNRALELIPTYTWAWGMRATVYRLAQEYEDSYWDLEVETVIAQESEVLQYSSSPVSFLESRRINLHEHALICFYLTKKKQDQGKKERFYGRAIAYAKKAWTVQQGDLIARLILIVIEAKQKQEKSESLADIIKRFNTLKEDVYSKFSQLCETVLRYQLSARKYTRDEIKKVIDENDAKQHVLTKLVLNDVIDNPSKDPNLEKAKPWLWKNFALTETCSNVLFLLNDLSSILQEEDPTILGTSKIYRDISYMVNYWYTLERIYQTPVILDKDRPKILNQSSKIWSILNK